MRYLFAEGRVRYLFAEGRVRYLFAEGRVRYPYTDRRTDVRTDYGRAVRFFGGSGFPWALALKYSGHVFCKV